MQQALRGVGVLVLVDQHDVVGLALPVLVAVRPSSPAAIRTDLRVVIGGHEGEVEAAGVPVREAARGDPVVPLPLRVAGPSPSGPFGRAERKSWLGGEAPGRQRRAEPLSQFRRRPRPRRATA
jgi:hypothetical protein